MNRAVSFGQAVRERRGALGLTQAELARRAGCAPVTVRKIEADQLRPSVQLAELLALALNVPEKEQLAFVRLARDEPPPSPLPKPTPASGEIGLADLSGRSVKGFDLAEQVGSGGFGVVYRAVQPSVRRDVAVKIILPRYANQPDFIRRFEAEAHLVARLEHPHIVPLYDYWREPNAAYLIMRLLRGGSLEDRLEAGALSLAEVWHIVQQVGRALGAAHQQGVIHRDIKPANVLLDEEQNGYLADFGIAKNLSVTDADFTEEGALIGSPAYISPEQIKAEPVHPASDIYCFGLLLYEILTGKPAFRGPTPVAFLQQHLNDPVPSLFDHLPQAPAALDAILQRATAKEPADRFDDMAALLDALQTVLLPLIADVELPVADTAVAPLRPEDVAALDNPYRGLRAFTEADADNFFGRETLVQALLGMLSDGSDLERFVTVVGPSGSGKSSVVKAGLLPALRRGGLPGSDNWFIIDLTPGSHPWEELEAALLRVAVNPPDSLLAQLQADNRGLLRAVRRCLPDDGETELLLVIDQFEELFTLVAEEAVRAQFLQSLVTTVLEPNSRLRVVVTMRADFTDRPLQYVDFGELMEQRLALVLPLTPDELTQAITGPVDRVGMALEPELVTAIVQDVGEQPGMLPLLQYALTELFAQRRGPTLTLDIYRETGGVTGALARRADEIYDNLDADGQALARQLFLRLITLGEGVEDTRRRVMLAELESLSGQASSDLQLAIVDEYGKHRLLTFDHDPATRGATVEVAHEALLREWPRLRQWLRDSREDVRRQRLLAQAAQQWRHNGQDASYLLRGSRLTSFEAWAEAATVALTTVEHHFLQTSITARDARQATEEARRRRELETVQRLAETQSRAVSRFRQFAAALAVLLIIALGAAGLAMRFAQSSSDNAALAQERADEAVANFNLAATNEAEAVANANIAATREADAAAEANNRAIAEAEAAAERDAAQASERQALEAYSLSLAANARQALEADDAELALLLALAANNIENPPESVYQTLVDVAYAPGVSAVLSHNESYANQAAMMPNGKQVLLAMSTGEIELRDVESGDVVKVFSGHAVDVTAITINASGTRMVSGDASGSILLWAIGSEEILLETNVEFFISAVQFFENDSKIIFSTIRSNTPSDIFVWNLESGDIEAQFGGTVEGNRQGVRDMVLLPDETTILAGVAAETVNPETIVFWDLPTQQVIKRMASSAPASASINGVDIKADGSEALLATSNGTILQIDMETLEIVQEMERHGGLATTVAYSPDGKTAVSGGRDNTIIWWSLETGQEIQRFEGHNENIIHVSFINNDKIISTSVDGTTRIWNAQSNWELDRWAYSIPDSSPGEIGLAIDPLGRFVLSHTEEGGLVKIDYETGEVTHLISQIEGKEIFSIAMSGNGERALVGFGDGSLILWNLTTNTRVREWSSGLGRGIGSVALSHDGTSALSMHGTGTILLWDLRRNSVVHELGGHLPTSIIAGQEIRFLPGEEFAMSSHGDGSIIIWDLEQGKQITRLTGLDQAFNHQIEGVPYFITGSGISSDGRQTVSTGGDQSLILWDTLSGRPQNRFTASTGYLYEPTFLPSNTLVASTSFVDTLLLWEVESGSIIRQYRDPVSPLLFKLELYPRLVVHPDGQSAVTIQPNGSAIKWDLSTPSPSELMIWIRNNRVTREFTCAERQTYQVTPLCQDGISLQSSDELVEQVASYLQSMTYAEEASSAPGEIMPLEFEVPVIEPKKAIFGENRGTLVQNSYDVWTFDASAGSFLSISLLADNPAAVGTTIQESLAANTLDTALIIYGPSGKILEQVDDTQTTEGDYSSNAILELFVAPESGTYRIEARSFLDALTGEYTLSIALPEPVVVDPAILEAYTGFYLEGPWEAEFAIFIENERLVAEDRTYGGRWTLIPKNETEFIAASDGTIFAFTRDEAGQVDGYDVWLAPQYPPSGQWYRAERLGDLP